MADEGLLMNFSVGENPLQTKAVFKGGRWRDRLQAKKSSQRRREKNQTNGGTLTGSNAVPTKTRENETGQENSGPLKRQKVNGAPSAHSRNNHVNSKPHEVVSSLFTYNPSAKAVSAPNEKQTEDAPVPIPSNAPLDASLSTFTSLGLSPFLSTHLIQNLNLTAPTAIQRATITQLLREDSDAFIQAETGSGKTLAYLLPILQRIMALSGAPTTKGTTDASDRKREDERKINRTSGLFALILAPTRELTHQISAVLTRLLRPMPWLVAGTVAGGAVKNHEKARLRKGLNILVATPGRLVDHLDNTAVLDVGNVRWLVLDEGDRLMELGFEEDIKDIVQKLEKRKDEKRGESRLKKRVEGLPDKRTTVMCSATMKMGVQKLGEISLKDAVHIKADLEPSKGSESAKGNAQVENQTAFLAPAQLKQSYIVVPPKQRLVTLAALLKRSFARKGSVMKAIVFLSCADSVDFHFQAFSRKETQPPRESTASDQNTRSTKIRKASHASTPTEVPKLNQESERPELPTVAPAPSLASLSNPGLTLHELHGSLAQPLRTATLQSFSRSPNPCILLCTDVASRGLDLPNIDLVIEYDPPFSADDHLHRVGRTARAGKEGRACCFLMPGPEEGYVEVLKECAGESIIKGEAAEDVLRKGFGKQSASAKGKADGTGIGGGKWDDEATEWQLELERWAIENKRAGEMARKAYVSHVRAYATHAAKERRMFDVKGLHLGHLAKAFALRERPGNMGRGNTVGGGNPPKRDHGEKKRHLNSNGDNAARARPAKEELDLPPSDGQDPAKKMRSKMKEHMAAASEFNIG